jgi:ComF family protein
MDLLSLVFPKKCLECGRGGKHICSFCLNKVTFIKPVCPECLRPSIDGFTHTGCKRPQGLDGLICPWKYEGVVRKAILALKYKFAYVIASELSESLSEFLAKNSFLPTTYNQQLTTILVPVPLHWRRENWRGFNQSEEVGKLIAKKIGWKFIPDFLVRKKATIPQAELNREERLENIRGIFSCNSRYSQLTTNNLQLVLFDDVWTTGSTLKEACKVLKRKGIEKVCGVTIAR